LVHHLSPLFEGCRESTMTISSKTTPVVFPNSLSRKNTRPVHS
jgi:hypothetical protein